MLHFRERVFKIMSSSNWKPGVFADVFVCSFFGLAPKKSSAQLRYDVSRVSCKSKTSCDRADDDACHIFLCNLCRIITSYDGEYSRIIIISSRPLGHSLF